MSITKPLEGIRVESFSGDAWRFSGRNCGVPVTEQENPLFDIYNANKRDILINTKTEEGRQVLLRLLKEADVFFDEQSSKSTGKGGA